LGKALPGFLENPLPADEAEKFVDQVYFLGRGV
jgi:hypothetical protein